MEGVINKAKEPFSIRKKDFWDVADAYKLLRPEFTVRQKQSRNISRSQKLRFFMRSTCAVKTCSRAGWFDIPTGCKGPGLQGGKR